MALKAMFTKFHHPGVSRVDYKTLDMDRVLTALLARLWHQGMPSKLNRSGELDAEVFVKLFLDNPDIFDGFDPETTARWTTTHLLDMVKRGQPGEAVAAPRPLHGFAYRFRNSRKSRPYGADEQLYEMLAEDPGAIQELQQFFFSDVDRATGAVTPGPDTDVETQALLHLVDKAGGRMRDRPDERYPRKPYPPLCREPAQMLCQDVLRLLYHQDHMPRTVLVDYLKILLAFHLGLYHLRMIKLLPAATVAGTIDPTCAKRHDGAERCPYQTDLFLDATGDADSAAAGLAERSAALWYRRIPGFVEAVYRVKKLDEFAEYLVTKRSKASWPSGRQYFSAAEALKFTGKAYRRDRDDFFGQRVAGVLDDGDSDLPDEVKQIAGLPLEPFDEYIELLMHYKGRYHRGYIVESLDSMLLKHRPGATLAQPRGGRDQPRRFVLDSRLLEVLLQVSLLRPSAEGGLRTASMRVDEFLSLLRERYGLHIDALPDGDGFTGAHLDDQAALRENAAAFVHRLRETGYYQDLSDAYLTQTITPRYSIDSSERHRSTRA